MEAPMNFDPMTGQPINTNNEDNKKNNTGLILGLIIGGVVLLVGIIIAILMLVVYNGKTQVALATKNTVEEITNNNQLIKVFDVKDIVGDKNYSVEVDVDTELPSVGDISVEGKISVADDLMQASGDLDLSFLPSIEYIFQLDDHQLKGNIPLLDKYLFTYDYTKNNNGYLMQQVDTETLNAALSQAYKAVFEADLDEDISKELKDTYVEAFKALKYSKIKSSEYAIDGKAVKCKGYEVTMSADEINKLLTATNTILINNYEEIMDIGDIEDYISDYDGSDLNIDFYIYRNTLAAIIVNNDEEKIEIQFNGGNYRAQNIKVLENDTEIMAVTGSISDGVETVSMSIDNKYSLGYAYDTNKDKLTLNFTDGYDVYDIDMEVIRTKSKLDISMDFIDFGDTYIGGSLVLSDDADIKNLTGTEFNIGTATEDDIMGIVEEVYEMAMGLMGW